MTIRDAIWVIVRCAGVLALVGGGIGYVLGRFVPGYYRAVFPEGSHPEFDPIVVGLVQGFTQGAAAGATIGITLVAVFVWRDNRMQELTAAESVQGGIGRIRNDSRRFPWVAGWLFSLACCLAAGMTLGLLIGRQAANHQRYVTERDLLMLYLSGEEAFREIEIEENRLGTIWLRGHVAQQKDLVRLRALVRFLFGESREGITFAIKVKE